MVCTHCGEKISASKGYVRVDINQDSPTYYHGEPGNNSDDGLSCWQKEILTWSRLIRKDQATQAMPA